MQPNGAHFRFRISRHWQRPRLHPGGVVDPPSDNGICQGDSPPIPRTAFPELHRTTSPVLHPPTFPRTPQIPFPEPRQATFPEPRKTTHSIDEAVNPAIRKDCWVSETASFHIACPRWVFCAYSFYRVFVHLYRGSHALLHDCIMHGNRFTLRIRIGSRIPVCGKGQTTTARFTCSRGHLPV